MKINNKMNVKEYSEKLKELCKSPEATDEDYEVWQRGVIVNNRLYTKPGYIPEEEQKNYPYYIDAANYEESTYRDIMKQLKVFISILTKEERDLKEKIARAQNKETEDKIYEELDNITKAKEKFIEKKDNLEASKQRCLEWISPKGKRIVRIAETCDTLEEAVIKRKTTIRRTIVKSAIGVALLGALTGGVVACANMNKGKNNKNNSTTPAATTTEQVVTETITTTEDLTTQERILRDPSTESTQMSTRVDNNGNTEVIQIIEDNGTTEEVVIEKRIPVSTTETIEELNPGVTEGVTEAATTTEEVIVIQPATEPAKEDYPTTEYFETTQTESQTNSDTESTTEIIEEIIEELDPGVARNKIINYLTAKRNILSSIGLQSNQSIMRLRK